MKIPLWESTPPGYNPAFSSEQPALTPYLIKRRGPGSAVIVCPGGGYSHRAEHEGEPVARWLNQLGFSAFVLHYRVAPYRYPYPIIDGRRAVRLVRYRAAEWHLTRPGLCSWVFRPEGIWRQWSEPLLNRGTRWRRTRSNGSVPARMHWSSVTRWLASVSLRIAGRSESLGGEPRPGTRRQTFGRETFRRRHRRFCLAYRR